jgi:hypothetical protein
LKYKVRTKRGEREVRKQNVKKKVSREKWNKLEITCLASQFAFGS